jgi:hypothetical protein
MPIGLTNAPATFQALMYNIFQHYLWKFILVFFDGIFIYSINMEDHIQRVQKVLQILEYNQLYIKVQNATLGSQVKYLGTSFQG